MHSDGTVWLESHLRLTFWFLDQERPICRELGKQKYGIPTLAYDRRRFARVRRVSRQRATKKAAGSRPIKLGSGRGNRAAQVP